jgi:AraC-like DNA-binding protein/ligand-binding sensor protein
MNDSISLVDGLSKSNVFRDFQLAFGDATGLPLSFLPVESWQLPLHGRKHESGFCALMAQQSHSCAHCLQLRQKLAESATDEPCTLQCGAGLCESVVPVRVGEKLLGFLHTGQVFAAAPTAAEFDRTAKFVDKLGVNVDVTELRDAYFGTKVLSPGVYAGCVRLLTIFAVQLGLLASQRMERERLAEPPVIKRAKQFISDNCREDISLADVAKACNTSTFYFCKLFKRHAGLNFTRHLSNVRIEKAKNLLLNRELRVSEIGYEVGFQSLTHFNRVFKKVLGQSPTEYRERLPSQNAA